MERRGGCRVVLGVLLAGAALCAVATAQDTEAAGETTPTPTPPVFAAELEVNLLNVFVTVLDGRGRPVTGLRREDFAVFDHGVQAPITNFEEVKRLPLPALHCSASQRLPTGEGAVAAVPSSGGGSGRRRKSQSGAAYVTVSR